MRSLLIAAARLAILLVACGVAFGIGSGFGLRDLRLSPVAGAPDALQADLAVTSPLPPRPPSAL